MLRFEIDVTSCIEQGRADIAQKKAGAVADYMNTPGAELVVSTKEFRAWLGETGAAPQMTLDEPLGEDAVVQFNAMRGREKKTLSATRYSRDV